METRDYPGLYEMMFDVFFKNIGHDLRNPVNDILGLTELLIHGDFSNKKNQEFLTTIKKNGIEIIQLIDNLVLFSKLDKGQVIVERKACDINSMISQLFNKYYQRYINKKYHSINLVSKTPSDDEQVYLDETLVGQILGVLVDNAVKNTERGKIEFGYYYRDTNVVFYVMDTGKGIPVTEYEKIFDRFYRIKSEYKKCKGAGLGLSLAQELVTKMNGDIWLKSEEEEGTTFYFSIPCLVSHRMN